MARNTTEADETTHSNPFREATAAWMDLSRETMRASTRVYTSALPTTVNPFLRPATGEDQTESAKADSNITALDYSEPDWEVERSVASEDGPTVGDTVTFRKTISEASLRRFANASGDTNQLHLDDDFAEHTRFGRRIIHGTLVSGLISAALARLPGLTIYLSQDLSFERPADIGERLSAEVEVREDLGDDQYRLSTQVYDVDKGHRLIDGEATVLSDDPPDFDD